METKKVTLKYSIPIPKEGGGDIQTNELNLGRLKAKHLRLLPKEAMADGVALGPAEIIPLIAGLADIPESSADEIDIEDLMTLAEDMESFLSGFLETGEK